jgi:hypothetical protein
LILDVPPFSGLLAQTFKDLFRNRSKKQKRKKLLKNKKTKNKKEVEYA